MTLSKSTKTFFLLLFILALMSAWAVYLPMGDLTANLPQTAPQIPLHLAALANFGFVIVAYGLLGYLGLRLAKKLGFASIWQEGVSNRQRFLLPAIWGAVIGLVIIIGDNIFAPFNGVGHFSHPPFPTSLVASIAAGIGEEILLRLFFVSFWLWLICRVILRGRWQNKIFWIVAVLSALAFGAAHIPAVVLMYGFENVSQIPMVFLVEILLLNGILGIVAADYLRRYGFLAAAGLHLWADIVWHVIYGLF